MSPRHATLPLVLDTCVIVNFLRGNQIGMHMSKTYGLYSRTERPHVSVVTMAEMYSFAEANNWGKETRVKLGAFFRHSSRSISNQRITS
jgi:hypothetical protein